MLANDSLILVSIASLKIEVLSVNDLVNCLKASILSVNSMIASLNFKLRSSVLHSQTMHIPGDGVGADSVVA